MMYRKIMPRLAEPRMERFAQLLAKEVSLNDAYGKCIAAPGAPRATIIGNSWGFFKKHELVLTERKLEIQAKNARIAERRDNFTKEKLIDILIDAITLKPSQVSRESRVCEVKMSKAGEYYAGMDKLGCAKQLASMCGWNAPLKIEGDVDVHVTSWVQKIRQNLEQAKVIECDIESLPDGGVDFSCD